MTASSSNYNLASTHNVLSRGYRAGDFNGIIIAEGRIENCNETQRVKYFILYGVCHFFSFTFLALRIYTRVFIVKYFGQDDVWILISAVIAWAIIGFDLSCRATRTTPWNFREFNKNSARFLLLSLLIL
ncbi:hypothetical protein TWF191_008801 [Orbilia oligospora]|uniref:Uncharacterized protein n=1 Tax=Orbilia oligospora TaxID=2813651 RepID=A0A7C8QLP0_ORBOL|nr:hypothetical protein TWF191_008801 [Orbilia oligospora]